MWEIKLSINLYISVPKSPGGAHEISTPIHRDANGSLKPAPKVSRSQMSSMVFDVSYPAGQSSRYLSGCRPNAAGGQKIADPRPYQPRRRPVAQQEVPAAKRMSTGISIQGNTVD